MSIELELLPVRPMTEQDIDTVMTIEKRAFPFPWTPSIFKDCLKHNYSCWIYERDASIIGYAVMMFVIDEMHLLNICVDPDVQGQRLGSRLLHSMECLAQEWQAQTCFLEVRQSNFAAIRLYLNTGFNEVGLRKGYYPAKLGRENAIIMAKTLL